MHYEQLCEEFNDTFTEFVGKTDMVWINLSCFELCTLKVKVTKCELEPFERAKSMLKCPTGLCI